MRILERKKGRGETPEALPTCGSSQPMKELARDSRGIAADLSSHIKELIRGNKGIAAYLLAFSTGVWMEVSTEIASVKDGYYWFPNVGNLDNSQLFDTAVPKGTSYEIDGILFGISAAATIYVLEKERINGLIRRLFHRKSKTAVEQAKKEEKAEEKTVGGKVNSHKLRGILALGIGTPLLGASLKTVIDIANNIEAGRNLFTLVNFPGVVVERINQLVWQDVFITIPVETALIAIALRSLVNDWRNNRQSPMEHTHYKGWLASKVSGSKDYIMAGLGVVQSTFMMELDKVISGHQHLPAAEPLTFGVAATAAAVVGVYALKQQLR